MVEQGLPLLVIAGIALANVAVNLFFGTRVSDAVGAGVLEVNTPWKRPRILAGKRLVALWFAAALTCLATLPGVVGIDAAVAAALSGPAIVAVAFMTIAAVSYKGGLAQQPSYVLDERERGVREPIYLLAYRIIAGTLLCVGLAGYLAMSVGDVRIDWGAIPGGTLLGGAVLAATFVWALPSLVHAWRDPIPDEVNDETREEWQAVKRELGRAWKQRGKAAILSAERGETPASTDAGSADSGSTDRT